jgi:phosphoribosylanthranilate isomerase
MIVKAGKISNLTDARYFAAESVQYLGFNLEEGTKGYLDPIYMRAIREWVQGPIIVGEFGHTPLHIVKEAADFLSLEALQIRLPGHPEDIALFGERPLILETDFDFLALHGLAEWQTRATTFLVHVPAEACSASHLMPYVSLPIIWSLDAPSNQIISLLDHTSIYGMELVGGEEELVGVKSFDELNEIFDYLAKKMH